MIGGATIPSMTSTSVLAYLRELGRQWTSAGVAVECGCWLGASCAALAQGLVEAGYNRPIYCYDRWTATRSQVRKAARVGVHLHNGQDLDHLFRANVSPYYKDLILIRGRIEHAKCPNAPIELFILDAAKTEPAFSAVMRQFGPHWIPGVTIVGLQDYGYWRKFEGPMRDQLRCQERFVTRFSDHFELMRDFNPLSPVFFRYTQAIPWGDLA